MQYIEARLNKEDKMKRLFPFILKMSILGIIPIALAGCTHVLVPIDGPMYRGEMLEAENLKVEVVPGQYYMEFSRDDLFIPVYVIIRNNTDHRVQVGFKNFLMLDDRGNKYKPASLDDVLMFNRVSSFAIFPYHHHYGWHYPYYNPARWLYPHGSGYYLDMIRDSFLRAEKIEPGGEVEGFLYFKGAARFADEKVTLVAKFAENDMKPVEYVFKID